MKIRLLSSQNLAGKHFLKEQKEGLLLKSLHGKLNVSCSVEQASLSSMVKEGLYCLTTYDALQRLKEKLYS